MSNTAPFVSASPAYTKLQSTFTRLYRYQHLAAVAGWDQAAMMPSNGNDARGAAMAELAVLMHNTLADPSLQAAIADAKAQQLSSTERASLREMERQWQFANLLPASLVEAKSLAGSRCEHAWRTQRKANDWKGFLANFKDVLALSRQEATLLAEAKGCSRYDALLGKYEPGMNAAEISRIFSQLTTWLPSLIKEALVKQATQKVVKPQGPFAVEKQRALGLDVMKLLGFDFDGGRLDVSVHPFCGGVAEDVRITTRYREDDFVQSLMGVVHETGHARYEQNLPRGLVHLPVGQARSMGIHESQSLAFEMQLGRSPAFLELIAPLVKKHLGAQSAFDAGNLGMLYTRVRPDFIRVDADELTYPAHIVLRFEIEKALIEGELEAEDMPSVWADKMQAYLGIDTRDNYQNGCLQDIHWTDGSFGYFPSYTLGAMYAAQYFATMRAQQPDLDSQIRGGNLAFVFEWLNNNIWRHASILETPELIVAATGEPLSASHFENHLRSRYVG